LLDGMDRYGESIGIERYTLKDAPTVEIVVPPGQKHRREAAWSDVHANLAAGKYRGIILVSAFGFHSLGDRSYKGHRLYKGKKDAFLQALLKANRRDEIGVLSQLEPHITVNPRRLWFISLIAKQDLWWPNHTEVEKHYRESAYGTAIRRVLRQRAAAIRHEFVFASLLINNFATKANELLKPNSQGYDFGLQIKSLRQLFEAVDALKHWESGK
jgi:hypothetical protein